MTSKHYIVALFIILFLAVATFGIFAVRCGDMLHGVSGRGCEFTGLGHDFYHIGIFMTALRGIGGDTAVPLFFTFLIILAPLFLLYFGIRISSSWNLTGIIPQRDMKISHVPRHMLGDAFVRGVIARREAPHILLNSR